MKAGTVETVYAYDQDRIARDNWVFASILRIVDRRGVDIITSAGSITDTDRRDFVEMRGVMDGG